ncbi:hypothetical protein GGR57DRAFT_486631 [Xylariaceae sp. FL1272]|nr:hypothetical protein GGR57DRAFT_486631 [Xylariaceae sp. FL1272]
MLLQLALCLTIAVDSVVAFDAVFGRDNFYGDPGGPWAINASFFESLLQKPNATGHYPLAAPDVTKPFSTDITASPEYGWNIAIQVREDIPLPNVSYEDYLEEIPDARSKFVVGAGASLSVPPGVQMDESWELCVVNWQVEEEAPSDAIRTDDGTCSSVFSKKCRDAINKTVVDAWVDNKVDPQRCICPKFEEIDGCGTRPGAFGYCIAQVFNSTRINEGNVPFEPPDYEWGTQNRWENGTYLYRRYGGEPSAKGNITAYDTTATLAWPLMLVWGNAYREGETSAAFSQLTCPRAVNATAGSRVPQSNVTAAGERVRGDGTGLPTAMMAFVLYTIWMFFM